MLPIKSGNGDFVCIVITSEDIDSAIVGIPPDLGMLKRQADLGMAARGRAELRVPG